MGKRKLSGKTILKLTGAFFALIYLGFCLYAGITGKFLKMQEVEHVMRFGELKNWVGGGMAAVMIAALCLHSAFKDLNFQKERKKSDVPFLLLMILPIVFLLLLESYLDIGWIGIALYGGIAVFFFGIAWIPMCLNQWIARLLLREDSMSGKRQVQIIEWIHFYPLKKLLILGLWSFGVVLILAGIWGTVSGKVEMDGENFLVICSIAVLAAAFFKKMKRYVFTPYRSLPALNQILEKDQLEQLLDGECFESIPFKDDAMKRYLDIYRSQNWMVIGGTLLSKKLALGIGMERREHETLLEVNISNGMTAKAKVNLRIEESRYEEFVSVLRELIGYERTLKLQGKEEQMTQKFASFFPTCESEQERIVAFLSQDVTQIRQEYIQTFSPPENTRKKKRSTQERK